MTRTPDDIAGETGGPVDEAAATLAIYGDTLRPDDVTALFQIKPTKSFESGHKPGPKSPPITHGAWFYELRGRSPLGPEDLVQMLLARLPRDPEIWNQLRTQYRVRLRIALHMGAWNRGFGLSSEIVGRIAAIGAELDFDVYAYGDRDA